MMIETKPDGSFRVYQRQDTGWSALGWALWWLVIGGVLGCAATRAYFIISLGL